MEIDAGVSFFASREGSEGSDADMVVMFDLERLKCPRESLASWLADPARDTSRCGPGGLCLAIISDDSPSTLDIVLELCSTTFMAESPTIGGTVVLIFNLIRGVSGAPSTWGFGTHFLASSTRRQK